MTTPAREGYISSLPSRSMGQRGGFSRESKVSLYRAGVPAHYARATQTLQAADICVLHKAGVPAEYGVQLVEKGVWATSAVRLHQTGVPAEYVLTLRNSYLPSQLIILHKSRVPAEYALAACGTTGFADVEIVAQLYLDGVPVEYVAELDANGPEQ